MSKHYLSIDFKSSQLFEYSKEAKEGFEPQEGRSGYRRFLNEGITGELLNVGVRDSKIGQQINVALKDENGDYNYIQIGLYDQKGNVDGSFGESLIRYLPHLKKGETYRFYPYNLTAETQKSNDESQGKEVRSKYYDQRGISVKLNGDTKVDTISYNKRGEKDSNKIPNLEWKEVLGKNKPTAVSLEAKNEFLLSIVSNAVDGHLKYEGNTTSTPTTQKQETKFEPVEEQSFIAEDQDLPF